MCCRWQRSSWAVQVRACLGMRLKMLQFVLQHMLQHVVHHAVRHVVHHVVGHMAMLLAMRFVELDDTGRGVLVDVDDEAGQFTIELWDSTVIQQPWAEVVLPEGTWLRLDGLQNKPNLNGRCGAVLSFDRSSGRYEIRLGSGDVVRIKPQNVRLVLESPP